MPRYLVERTFPDGLSIPVDAVGAEICLGVVDRNADDGVTWVHSYVTDDRMKSYCVYDAPTPEAIRRYGAAQRASRRPHHQGDRPRPVLLPPRELIPPSLAAGAPAALSNRQREALDVARVVGEDVHSVLVTTTVSE